MVLNTSLYLSLKYYSFLPFGRYNHECHGHYRYQYTDNRVCSERLAQCNRTHQDGRNRFEHPEYRSLRSSDVSGRDGERSRRDNGRKQRQSRLLARYPNFCPLTSRKAPSISTANAYRKNRIDSTDAPSFIKGMPNSGFSP